MMSDTIRLADARDVPALFALLRSAYAAVAEHGVEFTIMTTPIERVAQTVEDESTFVIERTLADGSTTLAATLTVRFPWAPDGGKLHQPPYPSLHWFAVAPEFKRQGLATTLLTHVEDAFLTRQLKAPAVCLGTASNHPWLQPFYERQGYVPFEYVRKPGGTSIVRLRKVLIPARFEAEPAAAVAPATTVPAAPAPVTV